MQSAYVHAAAYFAASKAFVDVHNQQMKAALVPCAEQHASHADQSCCTESKHDDAYCQAHDSKHEHLQAVPKRGEDPQHDAQEKALLKTATRCTATAVFLLAHLAHASSSHVSSAAQAATNVCTALSWS